MCRRRPSEGGSSGKRKTNGPFLSRGKLEDSPVLLVHHLLVHAMASRPCATLESFRSYPLRHARVRRLRILHDKAGCGSVLAKCLSRRCLTISVPPDSGHDTRPRTDDFFHDRPDLSRATASRESGGFRQLRFTDLRLEFTGMAGVGQAVLATLRIRARNQRLAGPTPPRQVLRHCGP